MIPLPGCQRAPADELNISGQQSIILQMINTRCCAKVIVPRPGLCLHGLVIRDGERSSLWRWWSLICCHKLCSVKKELDIGLPCSALCMIEATTAGHTALGEACSRSELLAEEADAHAPCALDAPLHRRERRARCVEALATWPGARPGSGAPSRRTRDGLLALGAHGSCSRLVPCD